MRSGPPADPPDEEGPDETGRHLGQGDDTEVDKLVSGEVAGIQLAGTVQEVVHNPVSKR